jgi:hypothetical protein
VLTAPTKGIVKEKTTLWITEHTPWLKGLPQIENFELIDNSNQEQLAFLYNSQKSTIWQQLKKHIGRQEIVKITTISPYYDTNGRALTAIKEAFPTAQIHIVMDEKGILPVALPNPESYLFYDWQDLNICRDIGTTHKSRLHAKILYLKTSEGIEYCLFGSANITAAGLGISTISNAEVSLLIKTKKGDLWNRIGLELTGKKIKNLSEFKPIQTIAIEQKTKKSYYFDIKLLSAELDFSTLTLYFDTQNKFSVFVVLFDSNNQIIDKESVVLHNERQDIRLSRGESSIKYVQIYNAEGISISNKIIVCNYLTILKTNPNPLHASFEAMYNQIQNGELSKFLDLIHYVLMDKTDDTLPSVSSSAKVFNSTIIQASADQNQLYSVSSYMPLKSNHYGSETVLFLSPTSRVLDILKLVYSDTPSLGNDLYIDEHSTEITVSIGLNENERALNKKNVESDVKKLKNFFTNLHNYLHKGILFKNNKKSDYKLTLTDLTKYLIAMELLHEFGGKTAKIEQEQSHILIPYLPVFDDFYENNTVKGCCLNIVGDFLRLAINGFKDYEFDYTKKRLEELQNEILVSTVLCIVNTPWKNEEEYYFQTLLLNTIHYIGWKSTLDLDKNLQKLTEGVRKRAEELKQPTKALKKQLNNFQHIICPAFKRATENRENKKFVSEAAEGQIIYSSVFGYCHVWSVEKQNKYYLARPGFEWNDEGNDYINPFKGIDFQTVELTKMTIVDL